MLAAGSGRRVGGPKALLRLDGALLIEHALRTVRKAGLAPVIVVLGAAADRVQAAADLAGASVLVNKAWGTGMGSSLRAGLAAATETAAEAVLVLPVDMPGITVEAVQRVGALPYRDALVCGTFEGRRGYPMLLGRAHWSGISTLAKADVGARPYLLARASQVTEIACDQVARAGDVDTPEEAARWGIVLPGQVDEQPVEQPVEAAADMVVVGSAGGAVDGAGDGAVDGAAEGADQQPSQEPARETGA